MADEQKDQGASAPKKGGFGAFSQQYRDRWATKHPDAASTRPADGATPPAAPAAVDAADGGGSKA